MKRLLSKNVKKIGIVNEVEMQQVVFGEEKNSNQQLLVESNEELSLAELDFSKIPKFNEFLQLLSPKESVIMGLILGCVDGKRFSISSIAEFLGISEDEISEIVRKSLMLYRENIGDFSFDGVSLSKKITQKRK